MHGSRGEDGPTSEMVPSNRLLAPRSEHLSRCEDLSLMYATGRDRFIETRHHLTRMRVTPMQAKGPQLTWCTRWRRRNAN